MNPKHFDFGLEVMRRLSEAVTVEKLGSSLGVTREEKEKLLNDEKLKVKFLEVTEDHIELEDEEKLKVLRQILGKVANVKFHDVVMQVGRMKTGRGGSEVSCALEVTRGRIEVIALNKEERKKMKNNG